MLTQPLIQQRKADNEEVLRAVLDRAAPARDNVSGEIVALRCECPDFDCTEILELTVAQYDKVRSAPARFVVAPGHEIDTDVVVAQRPDHVIVEKQEIEGRLAVVLDERSRESDFAQRAERVRRNEGIYREINVRIVSAATPLAKPGDELDICCECGSLDCTRLVRVRLEEYDDVRSHEGRFVVARGHRSPATEVLLYRRNDMEVVEKLGPGLLKASTHERE
ncbi:MAG: hypothetical protein JWM25_1023 [Thermoleophilia bacterium]|nr:hypothetical protein [Thermoleophilia bacterium]MCZ4496440.1 hypothetical protein [Thermoleophilia bacterium]